MILAILTRFSDSRESRVEYLLCQKLAEQGYQLYVTTTSTGEVLEQEIQKADDISTRGKGNVTLLQPQYDEGEDPQSELIITHHEKYFGFLSKFGDIQAVIGLLPGTEVTAVELKEALDCKLVFLGRAEIPEEGPMHKKNDLVGVAQKADEIWIFGSDIYHFYNDFFKNFDKSLCEKLMELSLQPFLEKFIKRRNYSIDERRSNGAKIISRWKSTDTSFIFRKEVVTKGSDAQSFVSLGSALQQVNVDTNSIEPQWHIYGMISIDKTSLGDHVKVQKFSSSILTKILSHTQFSWNNCSAFIVQV